MNFLVLCVSLLLKNVHAGHLIGFPQSVLVRALHCTAGLTPGLLAPWVEGGLPVLQAKLDKD